jgi:tRNA modification GTPase
MGFNNNDDTIAAIATPVGVGGVGIVRVSGSSAKAILSNLFVSSNGTDIESHRMLHGWLLDPECKARVDQGLACFMQAPKSYTGEDVVEFYCHGGITVVQRVLHLAVRAGARLAQGGEFTKRAFLNGKIDLTQAEAVLELVKARTEEGAGFAVRQLEGRLSKVVSVIRESLIAMLAELEGLIDFPDDLPEIDYKTLLKRVKQHIEEIEGLIESADSSRMYREGLATVIVGKPNVGKSSLLNALLDEDRAIVTDIPGTTRDSIEETINANGLPLRVIDTAGIRHPRDRAEEFGVERTERELESADFVVIVLDGSGSLDSLDEMVISKARGKRGVVVLNKADLGVQVNMKELESRAGGLKQHKTSALYGEGINELKKGLLDCIQRHYNGIRNAC